MTQHLSDHHVKIRNSKLIIGEWTYRTLTTGPRVGGHLCVCYFDKIEIAQKARLAILDYIAMRDVQWTEEDAKQMVELVLGSECLSYNRSAEG